MVSRPPVGFIVEGHGEYNCYPSLFCRIVDKNGIRIPRINAGGCGSVVKRLKEQLTDLFLADSPIVVIVTVDLDDVLKQGLANNCVELFQNLNAEIDTWRKSAATDPRLHPLPNRIACVVQVKKFESWLISDIDGLKQALLVNNGIANVVNSEEVLSPVAWLKEHLLTNISVKNPNTAKIIVSALDPSRMRLHSKSFDKFFRESVLAYEIWENSTAEG